MPRRRHHRRSRHHHHRRHRRRCHRRRRASSFFATERERGRADPLSGVMMLCKVVSLEERYLHDIFLCSNDSESAFSIVHDVSHHTSPPPPPPQEAGVERGPIKNSTAHSSPIQRTSRQNFTHVCVLPVPVRINIISLLTKEAARWHGCSSDCVLLLTIGDEEAASFSVGTTLLS